MHSGQVCAAGSRVFVQEGIYDKFVEVFKGTAASFKFGDGLDGPPTRVHSSRRHSSTCVPSMP